MNIATGYEIASADLAVALEREQVTDVHRQAVREAVGRDPQKAVEILNLLIVSYRRRALHTAPDDVKAEYLSMGLDKITGYCSLEEQVRLFFHAMEGPVGREARLAEIRRLFDAARQDTCEPVRHGSQIFCLRLLTRGGLVTEDIDFTEKLMETIHAIPDTAEAFLLPPIIASEV